MKNCLTKITTMCENKNAIKAYKIFLSVLGVIFLTIRELQLLARGNLILAGMLIHAFMPRWQQQNSSNRKQDSEEKLK